MERNESLKNKNEQELPSTKLQITFDHVSSKDQCKSNVPQQKVNAHNHMLTKETYLYTAGSSPLSLRPLSLWPNELQMLHCAILIWSAGPRVATFRPQRDFPWLLSSQFLSAKNDFSASQRANILPREFHGRPDSQSNCDILWRRHLASNDSICAIVAASGAPSA